VKKRENREKIKSNIFLKIIIKKTISSLRLESNGMELIRNFIDFLSFFLDYFLISLLLLVGLEVKVALF
jgi:hypothetical protein